MFFHLSQKDSKFYVLILFLVKAHEWNQNSCFEEVDESSILNLDRIITSILQDQQVATDVYH